MYSQESCGRCVRKGKLSEVENCKILVCRKCREELEVFSKFEMIMPNKRNEYWLKDEEKFRISIMYDEFLKYTYPHIFKLTHKDRLKIIYLSEVEKHLINTNQLENINGTIGNYISNIINEIEVPDVIFEINDLTYQKSLLDKKQEKTFKESTNKIIEIVDMEDNTQYYSNPYKYLEMTVTFKKLNMN